MVVDGTTRQIHQLGAGSGNTGVAGRVRIAQHRVGIGHVQLVAHQRHAKRRIEVFEQHRALVGHTVAVGVTQKRDAVGAGHAGAGAFHHQLHGHALDATRVGLGWGIGFGYQHIAIGQHMYPARVVQVARKSRHLGTGCGLRRRALGPAQGGRDVHCGNKGFVGRRQSGLGTGACSNWQRGHVATACQRKQQRAPHKARSARCHIRPITSSTTTINTTKPRPPLGP